MTIDDAIFTYLTDPARNAYAMMGNRLYPLELPQNPAYPAATYQQITSELTATGQNTPGDLEDVLLQLDCYAASHKAAKTLAKAIRADLSGYKGSMAGLNVVCHFQNEYDLWGDKAKAWRVTLEFKILFNP